MTNQALLKSKANEYGLSSLTDIELLVLLLGESASQLQYMDQSQVLSCCLPNTNALADKPSSQSSSAPSFRLLSIYEDPAELFSLCGVPKSLTAKLSVIKEISQRLWRQTKGRNRTIGNPEAAANYFMQELKCADEEFAYLLLLDTRNQLIKSVLIAKGSIDAAALSTREIIKAALLNQAAAMIMLHNHPSGVCSPSDEDIKFSRTLRDAGKLMNIRLQDSVIIGDNSWFSLRENGLL